MGSTAVSETVMVKTLARELFHFSYFILIAPRDTNVGFGPLWETIDDLQAYEHSAAYREMYAPRLRPFFSGEYTTYRCEVKYSQ